MASGCCVDYPRDCDSMQEGRILGEALAALANGGACLVKFCRCKVLVMRLRTSEGLNDEACLGAQPLHGKSRAVVTGVLYKFKNTLARIILLQTMLVKILLTDRSPGDSKLL